MPATPTITPAPCKPWCVWPDICIDLRGKHIDADAACLSEAYELPATLLPKTAWQSDEPTTPVLTVYAEQSPSQTAPTVYLGLNDTTGWALTPAEAVTLARMLATVSSGVQQ